MKPLDMQQQDRIYALYIDIHVRGRQLQIRHLHPRQLAYPFAELVQLQPLNHVSR